MKSYTLQTATFLGGWVVFIHPLVSRDTQFQRCERQYGFHKRGRHTLIFYSVSLGAHQ